MKNETRKKLISIFMKNYLNRTGDTANPQIAATQKIWASTG